MRNVALLFAGRYGAQAIEALILVVALRTLTSREVGVVFVAQAAAGLAFMALDFGLYPVLARRAARHTVHARVVTELVAMRAVGSVLVALAFYGFLHLRGDRIDGLILAFFVASGVASVHEIPRAVLAGAERFGALSSANIIGKTIEGAIACVGMWLGFGIASWVVGRLLGQCTLHVVASRLARAETERATTSPDATAIIKEGLPFFGTSLLLVVGAKLDTLLVAEFAGLAATAHFGVATRVLGVALGLVGTLTFAAYPRLSREQRRFITRAEATTVLVVSLVLGVALFIGAPLVVRIVEGAATPSTVATLRTMVPVVVLSALSLPLSTWLQAKQEERAVFVVTAASGIATVVILLVLVPFFGVSGAAIARIVRAAVQLAAVGLATHVVQRAARRAQPEA